MNESVIQPHGGYKELLSYQATVIIHDATVVFCEKYVSRFSRTVDQMVQAARSGKQNIVEACVASATSKKTELKLLGVARASLEELLLDYQDFLRQNDLTQWRKAERKATIIRQLAYRSHRSYETYRSYVEEKSPETAANTLICLIYQASYLLDRQIQAMEKKFLEEGGFTERLYRVRKKRREEG